MVQVFNRQLRIYGNSLPGHRDASVDGGHLLKVVDGVVARKHNRLALEVGHQLVEWRIRRNRKRYIKSRFLYDLRRPVSDAAVSTKNRNSTAAAASATAADGVLFVAFNRVIAGSFRSGSGLCRAVVTLHADQGTRVHKLPADIRAKRRGRLLAGWLAD